MDNKELWFSLIGEDLKAECDRLISLTDEMRAEGKIIFPEKKNVFKSIESVNPNDLKAVIIGQDPYHDDGQAMGLSFSVPQGVKFPPSLRNIFKELCADIGCENSHKKLGWQKLTGAITDVCATLTQPIVFLCWGRPALELAEKAVKKSGRSDKFIIASTHPSPLSANNRKSEFPAFIGSRPFSKANEILKENNAEPIDWAL